MLLQLVHVASPPDHPTCLRLSNVFFLPWIGLTLVCFCLQARARQERYCATRPLEEHRIHYMLSVGN